MPYRWTLTNLTTLDFEVLTNDPIGWDEGTYTIQRSERYKGIMHEYTTPLKFHCKGGGKDFIDAAYEDLNIDARVDILIEYDCDGSGTYDTLFTGIINFATYTIENDYTICQIERSDLMSKFINRDDISVDLQTDLSIGEQPITPIDTVILPMSSAEITYADTWQIPDSYAYETITLEFNETEALSSLTTFGMTLDASDMDTAQAGVAFTDLLNPTFETSFIQPLVTFNENGISYPITVDWEIDFKGTFFDTVIDGGVRSNAVCELQLYRGVKNTTVSGSFAVINLYDIAGYTANDFTNDFDIVNNGSFVVEAGDSIWLAWNVSSAYSDDTQNKLKWEFLSSFFKFSTQTYFTQTESKTVLIHEAFNQVVDAIADSDGNFISNFYGRTDSEKQAYDANGCGSQIAITNGLNIRQFNEKKITTSFRLLFQAMDAVHNLGAGYVNGKIQVEPLGYWYNNLNKIISLPFVNRYQVKDFNKAYINSIEVGYMKWESEFHGGLNDPNAKHEYSTKIKSTKNILQKLCNFLSSSYTIEFTRRKNRIIVGTEDWRYDNDNFLIATKDYYQANVTDKIFFNVLSGSDSIFIASVNLQQFTVGDTIRIENTSFNDGDYTVSNVINNADPKFTRLEVLEPLVNEASDFAIIKNLTSQITTPEFYADSFSSGSGMSQLSTAYNLRLTPKRMLLAHLNVITAGLQKIQGLISFVKGEGNTDLQVAKTDIGCQEDYDGQVLAENQNIDWTDDKAKNIRPLWLPQIYSFEYPLTYTQFKTIKGNPNGYIEFYRFENQKMAGYLMNMEYQLKTGMTKFELLRIYPGDGLGDEFGNYIGDVLEDEIIILRG